MMDLPADCAVLTEQQAVVAVAAAARRLPMSEFKGAMPSGIPCFAETRVGGLQAWVDKSGRYILIGAALDAETGKFATDMNEQEVEAK
jgi:hypothetical protein